MQQHQQNLQKQIQGSQGQFHPGQHYGGIHLEKIESHKQLDQMDQKGRIIVMQWVIYLTPLICPNQVLPTLNIYLQLPW